MSELTPLEVVISGELACFTRPENKVERTSYPVMTPSAARGVLEAIFWKPEFSWRVLEIQVLKEINWISFIRNEINDRQSENSDAAKSGKHYFADDNRAQRHTLALRDVSYLIRADQVLKPHATDDIAKYRDCFRRRVKAGQCFQQPFLGCREFAANEFLQPEGTETPVDLTMDLGPMLFDLSYQHDQAGKGIGGIPRFFEAKVEKGVLKIPAELYKE